MTRGVLARSLSGRTLREILRVNQAEAAEGNRPSDPPSFAAVACPLPSHQSSPRECCLTVSLRRNSTAAVRPARPWGRKRIGAGPGGCCSPRLSIHRRVLVIGYFLAMLRRRALWTCEGSAG